MKIGGLHKLTLLDYPNKISCIVFVLGCNMRCPFCHNFGLVNHTLPEVPQEEVFAYLKQRKNRLEGVVISGGEPLLSDGLESFIKKVKELGYCVKLDTNGSLPQRLKQLLDKKLIDYVAMDIKNSKDKYNLAAGTNANYDNILKSYKYILESGIDYELRTTVVSQLHDQNAIEEIGKTFKDAKRFFLQKFVHSDSVPNTNLTPPQDQEMEQYLKIIQKYIPNAKIR